MVLFLVVSADLDVWTYHCRMKPSYSGSGSFYGDLASRASSTAVSWISPVVSWFGGWVSDSQPAIRRRSASSQIAASLVSEVVQQGRMLEELQEQRRQQDKSDAGVADYR